MNIPQSAIEPFGVIGIPQLYSKEIIENALEQVIRELAEQIDRENAARVKEWYCDPRLRVFLEALDKIKT